MSLNLADLEQTVLEAVHSVLRDAAANEPTIDAAAGAALLAVGAPEPVASGVTAIINGLLDHFTNDPAHRPAVPEPTPEEQQG